MMVSAVLVDGKVLLNLCGNAAMVVRRSRQGNLHDITVLGLGNCAFSKGTALGGQLLLLKHTNTNHPHGGCVVSEAAFKVLPRLHYGEACKDPCTLAALCSRPTC